MLVFCLLIVIASWAVLSAENGKVERNSDQLAQNLKMKKELIDSMMEAQESQVQDPSILAQIERTQSKLNLKQSILDELKARETQKSNGFSDLMIDLASNHHSDLWLTNINLDERKLYLEGTAADSAALPEWVNKLGKAAYFNGKEFAGARMFRNDKKMLNFILSSELDDISEKAK